MKYFARLSALTLAAGFLTLGLTTSAMAAAVTNGSATPSATSVTIQWTTDILGSSQVLYGTTSSYGSQTAETDTSPRVLNHSVTVTGLTSCTVYHFQPKSIAVSLSDTIILGSDIAASTTGCTDATAAPASAAPSLADTGDTPYLYLIFLGAFLTVGYSLSRLRSR